MSHAPVLVHCNLGLNRSAAVVAGYFVRSAGIRASQSLGMVAAKRTIQVRAPLADLVYALSNDGFIRS
jgi:protein-tyrosine phosphatase